MEANVKRLIKISTVTLFFVFIVLYAFFVSRSIIFGVKIRDVNLENGAVYAESRINLSGNAKNAINLTLDDREISIDQEGNFNEVIALLEGYNIITIKALDKFGYQDEKVYHLIYQP